MNASTCPRAADPPAMVAEMCPDRSLHGGGVTTVGDCGHRGLAPPHAGIWKQGDRRQQRASSITAGTATTSIKTGTRARRPHPPSAIASDISPSVEGRVQTLYFGARPPEVSCSDVRCSPRRPTARRAGSRALRSAFRRRARQRRPPRLSIRCWGAGAVPDAHPRGGGGQLAGRACRRSGSRVAGASIADYFFIEPRYSRRLSRTRPRGRRVPLRRGVARACLAGGPLARDANGRSGATRDRAAQQAAELRALHRCGPRRRVRHPRPGRGPPSRRTGSAEDRHAARRPTAGGTRGPDPVRVRRAAPPSCRLATCPLIAPRSTGVDVRDAGILRHLRRRDGAHAVRARRAVARRARRASAARSAHSSTSPSGSAPRPSCTGTSCSRGTRVTSCSSSGAPTGGSSRRTPPPRPPTATRARSCWR